MRVQRRVAHWSSASLLPSEAEVERDILTYLAYKHYWFLQTHSGKKRPVKKGALDIVFGKGAVWGCIETKGEDSMLSDAQLEEMERVQRAKGIVIVARSLQDVVDALQGGET